MNTSAERKSVVRRAKKFFVEKFFVEENVDAIQWPQECAACGKSVEDYDDKETVSAGFKRSFGIIIPKIPYCHTCYTKVKAARRLDYIITIPALIFGISLGIFFAYGISQTMQITKTTLLCMGFSVLIICFITIKVFQLLLIHPIISIFKNWFSDYVHLDNGSREVGDKRPGWVLVITIPNKRYADKFAALNSVIQKDK